MAKVDKSKPLPEIFEALMAAAVAEPEEVKALPAPRSPEQDKQDCSLPASNTSPSRTMAEDLPAFLKKKHGLPANTNKVPGQGDVPFDPPYVKVEESESATITSGTSGSDGTTTSESGSSVIESPPGSDDMYKHKLFEGLVPVSLLIKILALFPGDRVHRVAQLANRHGEINGDDPVSKFRHLVIYDTIENLHKFERD